LFARRFQTGQSFVTELNNNRSCEERTGGSEPAAHVISLDGAVQLRPPFFSQLQEICSLLAALLFWIVAQAQTAEAFKRAQPVQFAIAIDVSPRIATTINVHEIVTERQAQKEAHQTLTSGAADRSLGLKLQAFGPLYS
jgi:hypothetical protein